MILGQLEPRRRVLDQRQVVRPVAVDLVGRGEDERRRRARARASPRAGSACLWRLRRSRSCGSEAAQSCDGCAAVWTTSSSLRPCAAKSALDALGIADVQLDVVEASYAAARCSAPGVTSMPQARRTYARMSFSTPTTSKPSSQRNAAHSEPTRPPDPVTIATGTSISSTGGGADLRSLYGASSL